MSNHSAPIGVLLASLAAGPVFLISNVLARAYLELPRPVPVAAETLIQLLAALLIALAIGFFLALIPNIVGTGLMKLLGARWHGARAPACWVVAGAASGAALAQLSGAFSQGPDLAFALVATSVICARISRAFAYRN
jgi:hypothetical protein